MEDGMVKIEHRHEFLSNAASGSCLVVIVDDCGKNHQHQQCELAWLICESDAVADVFHETGGFGLHALTC